MASSRLCFLGIPFGAGGTLDDCLSFSATHVFLDLFNFMSTRTLLMRVVFISALGLALWIGTISYRFFQRTGVIRSEIRELENEAHRINQENTTLREKIEYFSSASFQEREAKDKLGLKKIYEQVIVVKAPPDTEEGTENYSIPIIGTGRVAEFHSPNYVKWWRMLFDNQRPM